MKKNNPQKAHLGIRHGFLVQFVSIVVAAHGTFILATSLLDNLAVHRGSHLSDLTVDVPLLIGLGLIYLSSLLRRRKHTAFLVTMVAYAFYLGLNVARLLQDADIHMIGTLEFIRNGILPALIIILLSLARREFIVRSDALGFKIALRSSLTILLITFMYGVAGFSLLDVSDFHQEIAVPAAVHYTIDQFDLTTQRPVKPYTRRAQLFVDSLSFVSVAAVGYTVLSLFQPLRMLRSDQTHNRVRLLDLLRDYKAPSEDFFKVWPHDKQYYLSRNAKSALAFRAQRGVALCLGDPTGDPAQFKTLLCEFEGYCYGNDWLPAFVHVEERHRKLYEANNYNLQFIGQEAVIDLAHFEDSVRRNKYFRHINNKFAKLGYSFEALSPPHHTAVMERLQQISDDWLKKPGRVERGFVMGYFTEEYLQQCTVLILRDAAGTVQAFLNQVPAEFDQMEATYDMLRHTTDSPGNINDFLLLGSTNYFLKAGYSRLNLGLCPLVGIDGINEGQKSLIDTVLYFAYANGDRFYSFGGLQRFKAKYEPEWHDRYIAYQGGVRGFTRTMNALMRAMRLKTKS